MTNRARLGRAAKTLPETLNRRLSGYALAAGATASLLSMPQAAHAEIVYTPTDQTVGIGGKYNLDLNNDGTPEFLIEGFGGSLGAQLDISRESTGIEGIEDITPCNNNSSTYCTYAAAVQQGDMIPGKFARFASEGARIEIAEKSGYLGYWQNVRNHYLGLEFQISGKKHYGWARMSVQVNGLSMTAHITGYAYETVANQPIHAGQRTEMTAAPSSESAPAQGSLGSLARGASGSQR